MSTPEILPIERQLESLIADNFSELAELLADMYEANGTFVDTEFESRFPEILYIIDAIMRSMDANRVGPDAKSVYVAIYEAIYFAYSAASAVVPGGYPGVMVSDYYNEAPDVLFEKIVNDARSYLLDRPATAGLIRAFITSIDTSAQFHELAENIAAVTFMHIEAGEREQYIDQEVNGFIHDIDKWGNADY